MGFRPRLTVLSFSGGKQSSCLLWMVLLGIIKIDKSSFVVLNADPGMENSTTYDYVEMMEKQCNEKEIEFYRVQGRNLYDDIINLKEGKAKRIDNPPYWTKNADGSIGRLTQGCTYKYKIQPMDKEIRKILNKKFGVSLTATRLRSNLVEKWIGFSKSEIERIKPPKQKYITFAYPLIELGMTNQDVFQFFKDHDLPIPQRSVCNACFANGLNYFKDMFHNRPNDWKQAINIDNTIRNWTQIGVKNPVFVSSTCIPLEKLAEIDFDIKNLDEFKDKEKDYSCDSGYCFL